MTLTIANDREVSGVIETQEELRAVAKVLEREIVDTAPGERGVIVTFNHIGSIGREHHAVGGSSYQVGSWFWLLVPSGLPKHIRDTVLGSQNSSQDPPPT